MTDLEDQIVLITGAASGIGRAAAEAFASCGARVVIVDRIESHARAAAEAICACGGSACGTNADVSISGEVDRAVTVAEQTFGPIDILVNNAGVCAGSGIIETDDETWDTMLAVDLKAAFLTSKRILPQMIDRGSGVIVNVASVNGLAYLGNEAYSAAKAGLISLTQSIAVRYGKDGVRCVAIAPGTIMTPAWDERARANPALFERLEKLYPLGRLGVPADVAQAILFLSSRNASWITGSVLRVDGGLLAGNESMAREFMGEG